MPQEYTISQWKPWVDQETGEPIRDQHGNEKGSVLFAEASAEPIDATFKPPVQPGQKKYGVVDHYTTRKGSVRLGFTRKDRPKDEQQSFGVGSKKEWQPRDDMAIRAQWAIGQAVSMVAEKPNESGQLTSYDHIEAVAKQLFGMVDRVKGSSESANPKELQPSSSEAKLQGSETPEMTTTTISGNSGYDKAKAQAEALKAKQEPEEDIAYQDSLAKSFDQEGEFNNSEINLADIPF